MATHYSNYDDWKLGYPDEWDEEPVQCDIDFEDYSLEELIEKIDYGEFSEDMCEECIQYLITKYDFDYNNPKNHI
jgi:hypothetical protein